MAFGIPPLLNGALGKINSVELLVSDARLVLGLFAGPKWGIYMGQKAVIVPDSIVSFTFKKEWRISDYPLEQGAFESYNKVNTPFDVRVRMIKGGTTSAMSAFLTQVEAAAASLSLYNVVTPQRTYLNANIENYGYDRKQENGAGMIIVDIKLTEIRITTAPQFTSTAAPSGASPQAGGTVQTQPPTPTQAAAPIH